VSAAELQQAPALPETPTETSHVKVVVDVEAAFAMAEDAMQKSMSLMTAGCDIQDCVPDLARFFQAQGEILIAVIQEKSEDALNKKNKKKKKTEDEFISLMRYKKLVQLETDLKELLIYTGNGVIYEEMVRRRSAIVEEFQKSRIEEFRELELERIAQIRHKNKVKRRVEDAMALLIGGAVIIALIYSIWAMLQVAINK
jgi:anaerobic ribonucleoside-triphosphate reductase